MVYLTGEGKLMGNWDPENRGMVYEEGIGVIAIIIIKIVYMFWYSIKLFCVLGIRLKWNEGHYWTIAIQAEELPSKGEYKFVV